MLEIRDDCHQPAQDLKTKTILSAPHISVIITIYQRVIIENWIEILKSFILHPKKVSFLFAVVKVLCFVPRLSD